MGLSQKISLAHKAAPQIPALSIQSKHPMSQRPEPNWNFSPEFNGSSLDSVQPSPQIVSDITIFISHKYP